MYYYKNVLDYLYLTAARLPEKPAFCDEKVSYTYGDLLCKSQAIGTEICRIVPRCSRPVVLLVDRTAISVLGLLSVLQAGCYYVPLDKKMPSTRMGDILTQVRPALILYAAQDARIAHSLTAFAPILELEAAQNTASDTALLEARQRKTLDIDPAYMIFTSGSTGTPKGILVSHRSVIDFTEWMTETCHISESDVLANQAPFYFDLSVKDLYQTLKNGATTHIIPQKNFMFPTMLIDFLKNKQITALIWATSAFRLVASSGIFSKDIPHTVRKVILGGEALQASHLNIWRKALPECQFINLYGPTEVTVDCTYFPITKEYADGEMIPIGTACRNMEILLLDDDLQPVAPSQPGEICVRGAGLAIGYFGDWDKTSQAFIQNPLNPDYPDRIYRTGDLACEDADGNLIFLSRKDGQIKHMGYRIELGEIETALDAVGGLTAAACFFDKEKDQIICAYQGELVDKQIISALKQRLPQYMIPNVYRHYTALPHNANGKIDRAALQKEYEDDTN